MRSRFVALVLAVGVVGLTVFLVSRFGFLFRTETESFPTAVMETHYRWGSPVRTSLKNLENPDISFWTGYSEPELLAVPFAILGLEVPKRLSNEPTWSYFDRDSDSHDDVRVKYGRLFLEVEHRKGSDGGWVEPPEQERERVARWVDWTMFGDHSEPYYDFIAADEELGSLINKAIEEADSEEARQRLIRCAEELEASTVTDSNGSMRSLEAVLASLNTQIGEGDLEESPQPPQR